MRAIVVGAVESTAVAIAAIADAGWQLPLVVTLPSNCAQRHSDYVDLAPNVARAKGTVHLTKQVNAKATIDAIRSTPCDYIFVIGWSQICGPDFLGIAPGRTIGYHPAPIPRMRGRAVIPWTILLDEPISAGTLFWIDGGVDSGPILEQQFFHVARNETAGTLYAKHMDVLRYMMSHALGQLAADKVQAQAQDESCATYCARRTIEDGLIDWTRSAREIDRLVRAVGRPYPGAYTSLKGERLTIWQSAPMDGPTRWHAQPGQVVSISDGHLAVQTGDGLLRIDEWYCDKGHAPLSHSLLGRHDV
ncbi:methionyl-tRNA formyltransferase [Novosphingobium lentum]|uniref:methionyl-tRNA formyltransferase n=1 Tax=Novosphingobium lentum TaxID=145287 RepID=UPI00082B82A8|nr:methionyl-tRNA formyltransferase [Novosphingobium lentum]